MAPPVRISIGIGLCLVALILSVAMLAFTGDQVGASAPVATNPMGGVGAWASYGLLRTAGLAAFLIPAVIAWGGAALIRDRDPHRAGRRLVAIILLVPALAGLVHALPLDPDNPLAVRWGMTEFGGLGGALGHLFFGAGMGQDRLPVGFLREALDVAGGCLVLGVIVVAALWLLDLGALRLVRLLWSRLGAKPATRKPTTQVFEPYVPPRPAEKRRATTSSADLEAIAQGQKVPAGADELLERIRAKREEIRRGTPEPEPMADAVMVPSAHAAAEPVAPAGDLGPTAPVEPTLAPVSPSAPESSPTSMPEPEPVRPPIRRDPTVAPMGGAYALPSKDLLDRGQARKDAEHDAEKLQTSRQIEEVFGHFDIGVQVVAATRGPVVTQYEIRLLDQAMRVGKVEGYEKDLALKLGTEGIRIVAPLPNKSTIGIEVPNRIKQAVVMRELVDEVDPATMALPVVIGRDVVGRPLVSDLAKMPHLLVAGATGMGKSVCMNAIICSILLYRTPEEVQFLMVDPKQVELSGYEGIPHLLSPPITDMEKAHAALEWACRTMDERYEALRLTGCRNILDYNALGEDGVRERLARKDMAPGDLACGTRMTYIVILVDEYADLMMVNKEVEKSIVRLAAKSRACGIHVILTTQRPSADVVTGLIKSNLPSRICFRVVDRNNSRVVLDVSGAENLLGKGDLLFLAPGASQPVRGQGVFLKDSEINAIVEHAKSQGTPQYDDEVVNVGAVAQAGGKGGGGAGNGGEWVADRSFHEAVQAMYRYNRTGADFFRRKCNVGYNKATAFVEQLEDLGFVSPAKGTAPREILRSWDDWIDLLKEQGCSWEEGDEIYRNPVDLE